MAKTSDKLSRIFYGMNTNPNAGIDHMTVDDIQIDKFLRNTQPVGSFMSGYVDNLRGLNHQKSYAAIPDNKDDYGLAFFTRPMFNLTTTNIRNVPTLYNLLTKDGTSVFSYIRHILDPRLHSYRKIGREKLEDDKWVQYSKYEHKGDLEKYIKYMVNSEEGNTPICPIVDNKLAFIPILGNMLVQLSGFPDNVLSTYTSKEGMLKEQWAIGDGHISYYQAFDLDCTFRNSQDEPIIFLIDTWLRYIEGVFSGMLMPYMDMIAENEIDYMTRIYRLVLDGSRTIVKKIAATGASFPVNIPNGKFFDFSRDSGKYNTDTETINVRFTSVGAMYNEQNLVQDFNITVGIFNPDLLPYILRKEDHPKGYDKIPYGLLPIFNCYGYPVIDDNTMELEWFINTDSKKYKEFIKYYEKDSKPIGNLNVIHS